MDDVCRLCCSAKFVNNYIFDEENALFLKMSLYLPIKVLKNDRLPQKVCDKCSCKVNDFYQFCNEAIEVQNRLKGVLPSLTHNESTDPDIIKRNIHSPPSQGYCHQATQTNENDTFLAQVKDEPRSDSPLEIKSEQYVEDNNLNDVPSKGSEDELLVDIKKKPGKDIVSINGERKESKKGKKKKTKQESDIGDSYPDNVIDLDLVKEEVVVVKRKSKEYSCCICSNKWNTKLELLNHYKHHAACASPASSTPPPPPAPPGNTQRCMRCQKAVVGGAAGWAEHWRRHYALDTRPLRCGLCAHTFRDPYLIMKHGLAHRAESEKGPNEGEGAESALMDKRFLCDICPEAFTHLRFLLAHRTRTHPEAAAVLRLRCGLCARAFAHINSLRRHLRGHTGERNYLCNVCGKALSSREHLTFHIRIHTGYKPHICKVCGKGFVKKCNLTLHERVHTGEKPHVCPHCGKAFSQRSTLVIHERYHSGARPYTCALCGRGFVAKGLLSMHLKTTCVEMPQSRPTQNKLNAR